MLAVNAPLSPTTGSHPLFLPHWQLRKVERDGCIRYDVIDSESSVVAANVRSLEFARLFALAPLVFEHFKRLEREAGRALSYMLDVNEMAYDLEDVASDADGEWERTSPGAPDFARWLMELNELRVAVGEQQFPPPGVPQQARLFVE